MKTEEPTERGPGTGDGGPETGWSCPAPWTWKRLGEIHAGGKKSLNPQDYPDEEFEYYSIPAYQAGQLPILEFGGDINSAKLVLKPGTVLFGKLNPRVEKVWRVGNYSSARKIGSTEWIPVLPTEEARPDFVYYLLWSEHVMPKAKQRVTGSTPSRQRVDPRGFYDIMVPLPPLPEQRSIAAILSLVQRTIEQQEQLIALVTELKKALMQKLFTEGTRGEPLKETEIGMVPEGWEVVELGEVAKIGNGSTPKRNNSAYWDDGTIPWLTSGKIHEGVIRGPNEFVTERARSECHLPLVKKNSVLVAITGQGKTLGNAAIVTFDTCVSQHLAYVQFYETANVNPYFVLYFLQNQYDYLRSLSVGAGSTKRALTCGVLKRFLITVPSKHEQDQIAELIRFTSLKLGQHIRLKNELKCIFRTLLQQLMAGELACQEDMNVSHD